MTATALVPVEFHGATLYAITINGVHFVVLRPICNALGIDWEAQRLRIRRHPVLNETACVTKAVAADGKEREVVALPLDKLNGWLFGVSVNRVKPELRETLIQYQRECFDVLARHFLPAAPQPEPQQMRLDYDRISPAQKQDLKEIVDAIAKAGIQTYAETWARLQKKFRVNSYLELPATLHLEARAYLLAKLPKASAAPAPSDLQTICFAATHASVLVHAKVFRALQHNAQPNAQECLRFMLPIDLKELRNSPARLTDLHTFTHEVAHGECLIPTTDLLALAYACNSRAHKRLHGNSPHAIAE